MRQLLLGLFLLIALVKSEFAQGAQIRSLKIFGPGQEALCVQSPKDDPKPGQDLILALCHGDVNQAFTYSEESGHFQSAAGAFCIDAKESLSGSFIGLAACGDSSSQKYLFEDKRIHLKDHPDLCLSGSSEGTPLSLLPCSTEPQFQVELPYANSRFDQVAWLTTHNSHVNNRDANWIFANQDKGIEEQLRGGVRAFMIDVFSVDGEVVLCHGSCKGAPGFNYANPRQTLAGFLQTVTDYMEEVPDAIVTVFLEDYSLPNDLQNTLVKNPSVIAMLFNPYSENISANGWPTLESMVKRNKRLLFISDHSDKKSMGVAHGKDFTVENYWSLGLLGDKIECKSRWDEIGLGTVYAHAEPLFVMNHFRDIPGVSTSASDNAMKKLFPRLTDICMRAAHRKPSFLAVDHFEQGQEGANAREAVRTLNRSRAEIYSDAAFGGAVQLLTPGDYRGESLSIGAKNLSSFRLAPGSHLEFFESPAFTDFLFESSDSMSFVGATWNDRVSSLKLRGP